MTPELRERARQAPDSWLYVVDPAYTGTGDVPGSAVAGAYCVDEHGEITGGFIRNADYRPSPLAWGFPAPGNELEAALQAAVTGRGDDAAVRSALLAATLYTPSAPDRATIPVRHDEVEAVPAYTSEGYLPELPPGQAFRPVPVRELGAELAGRHLLLNPGSALEVLVPGADLAD
ncbi:type VII secretion system-associated protein [Amycolatopsis sp. PS_44_ISF1]|uniref:type VII secretion system-associated protein n=1 Tax=Amycolatopsis sp. PS_44_ISF1 TaxID=2974917 RepID=UPI0028DFAC75|nr:type VII secretion system-associated protein [Amycolatopsis sp. PS_44_ISF1]MDT8914351.1 type VII secretion system-associated protein [Amycolatopsis sp. PS_44_ISF1]